MDAREAKVRQLLAELADVLRQGYPPEALIHLEAIVGMAQEMEFNGEDISGDGAIEIPVKFIEDWVAEKVKG